MKFYYFLKNLGVIIEFSIQKRWEIIFLYFHELGPQLSIRAIAKRLHCSRDTVQTWIKTYQETGHVQDEEGRGRKRKTTEKEDLDIINIVKKQRTSTLADISTAISRQGVDVSLTTVQRRLNEQGLHKLQPLKKPLLSETHRDNRLE